MLLGSLTQCRPSSRPITVRGAANGRGGRAEVGKELKGILVTAEPSWQAQRAKLHVVQTGLGEDATDVVGVGPAEHPRVWRGRIDAEDRGHRLEGDRQQGAVLEGVPEDE